LLRAIKQVQKRMGLLARHHKQPLIEQGLLGGLKRAVQDEIGHRLVRNLGGTAQHGFLLRRGAQAKSGGSGCGGHGRPLIEAKTDISTNGIPSNELKTGMVEGIKKQLGLKGK